MAFSPKSAGQPARVYRNDARRTARSGWHNRRARIDPIAVSRASPELSGAPRTRAPDQSPATLRERARSVRRRDPAAPEFRSASGRERSGNGCRFFGVGDTTAVARQVRWRMESQFGAPMVSRQPAIRLGEISGTLVSARKCVKLKGTSRTRVRVWRTSCSGPKRGRFCSSRQQIDGLREGGR